MFYPESWNDIRLSKAFWSRLEALENGEEHLGQIAKIRQKLDWKTLKNDGSYSLCLQRFDKFWK